MAHAAWADTFARRADPSYSPQNVQRFAPYRVTLEKGIWRVRTAAEARVHGRAPSAVILANDGTTYIASSER
jgi:hypothetical protein